MKKIKCKKIFGKYFYLKFKHSETKVSTRQNVPTSPNAQDAWVKIAPSNKTILNLWHPLRQYYKKGTPFIKYTAPKNST